MAEIIDKNVVEAAGVELGCRYFQNLLIFRAFPLISSS